MIRVPCLRRAFSPSTIPCDNPRTPFCRQRIRVGTMVDLPSGTVTFLFTDIEGSTALWERDPSAMATAVARHLTLLRAATEAHNGVLFKVVGDAVQAAFPTAPDAVAAALDAQRTLHNESWPEGVGPVRVRMALHTAAATPQDGDYL